MEFNCINGDRLCECYNIMLTKVSDSNDDEICYTYSVKFNHHIQFCNDNKAKSIILGRCQNAKPRFNRKILDASLVSIYPNNYEMKPYKSARDSILGLSIKNDIYQYDNEEIIICLKNGNKKGITSNNIQFTLFNNDVISCFNDEHQSGLPCFEPDNTNEIDLSYNNADSDYGASYKPQYNYDSHYSSTQSLPKPTKLPTSTPTSLPTPEPTKRPILMRTTARLIDNDGHNDDDSYDDYDDNDIQVHYPTPAISPRPTSNPSSNPTSSPSLNPTSKPSPNPTILPTINPTSTPTHNPTSLSPTISPTISPTYESSCRMNDLHDVCIAFDQSCGLTDDECSIYLDLIAQFITSLKSGNDNARLCLLGISQGIQILIDLNDDDTLNTILELISQQKCGDSTTNLLDALEITDIKFNLIVPRSDKRSLILFNNCISTDSDGNLNEIQVCNRYNESFSNPIETNANTYIVNIQSLNGHPIQKTNFLPSGNIDPNKYLKCLTNGHSNRIVSITQNNYNNANSIIGNITKQICDTNNDNSDDNDDVDTDDIDDVTGNDLVYIMDDKYDNEKRIGAFTESTRDMIKFVFVFVMLIITCNGLIIVFFAGRQSGSLDPCFGDINEEEQENDDDDDDVLYDGNDTSDCAVYDYNEDDHESESIENEIDHIKFKKYLNQKRHAQRSMHSKQFALNPSELNIYIDDVNLSQLL